MKHNAYLLFRTFQLQREIGTFQRRKKEEERNKEKKIKLILWKIQVINIFSSYLNWYNYIQILLGLRHYS